MKILHLTPHLGGGVGTVVRGLIESLAQYDEVLQQVLSLDNLDGVSCSNLKEMRVAFADEADPSQINDSAEWADVILVHWWNHPLLTALTYNHSLPAARIVFWSHISGTPSPNNLTEFALHFPDRFIFTTPLSFLTPEVQRLSFEDRNRLSTIWSTAGSERLAKYSSQLKREATACYVGSLDYTKLDREFLDITSSLIDYGVSVNVVGPPTDDFLHDLELLIPSRRPQLLGFVDEDTKFRTLAESRIFPYPLARHHYATCDQAIQEAMALRSVPLVLNNGMESYMVRHDQTGIVSSSPRELLTRARALLDDEPELNRLADNAQNFALEQYSVSDLGRQWMKVFLEVMGNPKSERVSFAATFGRTLLPHEVFLHSLGDHGGVFKWHLEATTSEEKRQAQAQIEVLSSRGNWSTVSKSSATQFHKFFVEDEWLECWASLTRAKVNS